MNESIENESIESVIARIESEPQGNAVIYPDVMRHLTPFAVQMALIDRFKDTNKALTMTASRDGVVLLWAVRIDPEDGAAG